MAIDNHIRRGHPILFTILAILGIIEGSLTAWLVARFNHFHNYTSIAVRDRVRYLMFVSWWTFIISVLLGTLFLTTDGIFTSVASHGLLLFVTWVFWFAGALAVTISLDGGTNCTGVTHQLVYCNQLNAVIAFAWAAWAFTTISLVVVIIRGVSSLRRGESATGPLVNA